MALFGRFFGRAAAEGAGFAFGRASAPVLSPALEELRQEAWKVYATRIPDVAGLAAGVAEGKVDEKTARDWAERHGFGKTSFDALIDLATTAPDVGTAMQAWRRKELTRAQFEKVLKRHGIADEWVAAIEALRDSVFELAQVAAAIHRGLIPDPGLLQGEQPQPPFKVDAYPVYPIDGLAEAAALGFDRDHLGVAVGLQGLPMGVIEAAHAEFRGIITYGDFIRAFNTSNSRNEWAQAVHEYARQIPTARDFMENALRGHHDFDWAAEQAARHGMSKEDAFLIYQNQGRPLNLHQITQGLAWGGKYEPGQGDNADPWFQAVLLGAVRPEYYDLQRHLKYNLPSAFYFRTLQEQGHVTEAEAATWYKRMGWPPELADLVAKAYAKPATTAAKENPWVSKADNQLWTALHRAYVKVGAPRIEVEPILAHIEPAQAARNDVFADWDLERDAMALTAPAA